MSKLSCDIVTPIRSLFRTHDASLVVVPGSAGELGFMEGHTSLVTTIDGGEVRVHMNEEGEIKRFVVQGGYVGVSQRKVYILADRACSVADIDAGKVEAEKKKLEEQMKVSDESSSEHKVLQNRIDWCDLQLKIASHAAVAAS